MTARGAQQEFRQGTHSLSEALCYVIEEIRNDAFRPAVYYEDEQHQVPHDFHCVDI